MPSMISRLFSDRVRGEMTGRCRRSRRRLAGAASGVEALESRRLLAIDVFTQAAGGSIANGWVTLIASDGDDLYAQQIATKSPGLLVADNASFLAPQVVEDINSYADVIVTNAVKVATSDIPIGAFAASDADVYLAQPSDGYPLIPSLSTPTSSQSYFVLPYGYDLLDLQTFAFGGNYFRARVSNGVGGVWEFQGAAGLGGIFDLATFPNAKPANPTDTDSYFIDYNAAQGLGASTGPAPTFAQLLNRGDDFRGYDAVLSVTWNTSEIDPSNDAAFDPGRPPVLETVSFDISTTVDGAYETFTNIHASTPARSSFSLPFGPDALLDIVPGTLAGEIDVVQAGVRFQFTTERQTVDPTTGLTTIPVVFRQIDTSGTPVGAYGLVAQFNIGGSGGGGVSSNPRRMTGFLDPVSGTISLVTTNGFGVNRGDQEVGPITMNATFARYQQPAEASDFTLYSGQDFSRSLTVDLLAPGSQISIESPIIDSAFIDLRATDTYFEAPVSTKTELKVGPSRFGAPITSSTATAAFTVSPGRAVLTIAGDVSSQLRVGQRLFIDTAAGVRLVRAVSAVAVTGGNTSVTLSSSLDSVTTAGVVYLTAQVVAEQVFFNAANAANNYDIRLADDVNTFATTRSKMFVSTTGSLAGALPTGSIPSTTPFSQLYAMVNTGDVLVEGTINGKNQSYVMQSPSEGVGGTDHRGPYYFSTTSLLSGAPTGLIAGGVAAVTLGNDLPSMYDETQNGGSTAFNVVTMATQLDALRVQASDRAGNSLRTPFPYDLQVTEADDLIVDSVAASSLPISVSVGKALNYRATVLSASDVSLAAGEALQINAPLATMFGKISLDGKSVTVSNSVRVLDTYSDDLITDIQVTATKGDIQLVGPVTAVNRIALTQSGGTQTKIFGTARIVADTLSFETTGSSVSVRTDVRRVEGRSAGDIVVDESDDVTVNLTASGKVALTAGGVDVVDATTGSLVAALVGEVSGATALTVSAPKGSVDIFSPTSQSVVMGDRVALLAGTAATMQAAGNVIVRSQGGAIDVLDAPVAGLAAWQVRAVSTLNLPGAYDQRTPGTFPSTLESAGNGALVVDGVPLRVRDRVLLVGQDAGEQNGVYTVLTAGGSASKWKLARMAEYDTTAEAAVNARFRVAEGTLADHFFSIIGYGDTLGVTPIAVTAAPNRFGALNVRAVSTQILAGDYQAGSGGDPDAIVSFANSALPAAAFDGVTLRGPDSATGTPGDLVLVRLGISGAAGKAANGVYRVVNAGSVSDNWRLERVSVDEFDMAAGSLVTVDEGSLRTRVTGNAFQVRFDSLGYAPLTIEDVTTTTQTNIGSDDFNDTVTYVVSTKSGLNNGAGSLGKMLLLVQNNVAEDPVVGGPQKSAFRFANTVTGELLLTQQLPQITKQVAIDTAPRYLIGSGSGGAIVINGSRINTLRNGSPVATGATVHGLEIVGSGASFTAIAGLGMAGFSRGAAVRVAGGTVDSPVSGVSINRMTFGIDAGNGRAPNKWGVLVGSEDSNTPAGYFGGFTTIANNVIVASTVAGIEINPAASDGVRLVGNEVGRSKLENAAGIIVRGGANRIGLGVAGAAATRVSGKFVDALNFSLPANFTGLAGLYVGMAVSGLRILPDVGQIAATIAAISEPVDGVATVTIAGGSVTAGGPATFQVELGLVGSFSQGSKQIPIPTGAVSSELFIGQTIAATVVPGGTTITAIDTVAGTLTLSNSANQSLVTGVTLGIASRNRVAFNVRGIQLNGGSNVVQSSDVNNSVFSGVEINGVDAAGVQRIGRLGTTGFGGRSNDKDLVPATSNAIFSNGRGGIVVAAGVPTAQVVIRGNYLGVTSANVAAPNINGNIAFTGSLLTSTPFQVAAPFARYDFTGTYGRSGKTLTITAPTAHGLVVGDLVRITNLPAGMTAPTGGNFSVTSRLSDRVFTVTLGSVASSAATSGSSLSVVTSLLTVEVADHGLLSGHKLAFVTPGSTAGTAGAYTIRRMDSGTFRVSLPSALTTPTLSSGSVRFYRLGNTVNPPFVLKDTSNLDFEGNLHGILTASNGTSNGTSSGSGVLPPQGRPITPPRRR